MSKIKVAIVSAFPTEPVAFEEVDFTFEWLHEQLGTFDVCRAGACDIYVNDTGLLDGLPINTKASALRDFHRSALSDIPLVGRAIVVGPLDVQGTATSLSDEVTAALRNLDGFVANVLPAIEELIKTAAIADEAQWN